MTVVVWDGRTLAADREAGTQYLRYSRTKKIKRLENGNLIGWAGDAGIVRELLAWYEGGADPDGFPSECRPGKSDSARLMVITKDGVIQVYETSPYPIEFLGPYHAIGAGTEAALAVLLLGHDSLTAVGIASQVCQGCGLGVDSLELS